jgi:peptidoglycan/LPS O-acetylase OafA/YrhL
MPSSFQQNQTSKADALSVAIQQKFYPSLNGLRAFSILLVLLAHLGLSKRPFYGMLFNSALGVNTFFVISGFLITTLCIKEQNLTGSLSLRNFYIRRFLRIFPVAYLYIVVIIILSYFFKLHLPGFQVAGAMLYIINFSYFKNHHFTWLTAHYWSLSLEEQFYLLFPFILKKSAKFFLWAILFIIVALPVLCSIQANYGPLNQGVFYTVTPYLFLFQSIAIGCLFSILAFKKVFDREWIFYWKPLLNIVAVFLMIYLRCDDSYSIRAVYINPVIATLIGYIIISNIRPGNDFVFRILNFRAIAFIGIISYSLYIWQQIFTFKASPLPWVMVNFPTNMLLLFGVSCLSYFCYEKYFLKLKGKFTKVKTSGQNQAV